MAARNDKTTHPGIRSPEGISVVRFLKGKRFPNHRIAALFDENQGRVAEVSTKGGPGKRAAIDLFRRAPAEAND